MKPNRVATLNAGKFKAVLGKNAGIVILLSLLLVIISCDKGDDFEPIRNESPIDYESPSDIETPPDETPTVDEPPADNETPPDDEPPNDAESVIIYTDIDPDFTSQKLNDFYNLDLNNDQIFDFTVLSGNDNSWEWLFVGSNQMENGIDAITPWYNYIVPLNSDEVIYQNTNYELGGFFAIGECFASGPGCFYDWKNKGNKYLGLRIIINGQKHYGWARMDVTSATQWVIKDYAYNATPNKPILAGQRE